MLTLPPTVRVFVALRGTDLRRGFDGLAVLVRQALQQEPLSGHLFLFVNRRGDRAKVLFWDRTGWCIFYKRLEQGTFHTPKCVSDDTHVEIEAAELMLLLEGIELQGVRRRPRWRPLPTIGSTDVRRPVTED